MFIVVFQFSIDEDNSFASASGRFFTGTKNQSRCEYVHLVMSSSLFWWKLTTCNNYSSCIYAGGRGL